MPIIILSSRKTFPEYPTSPTDNAMFQATSIIIPLQCTFLAKSGSLEPLWKNERKVPLINLICNSNRLYKYYLYPIDTVILHRDKIWGKSDCKIVQADHIDHCSLVFQSCKYACSTD